MTLVLLLALGGDAAERIALFNGKDLSGWTAFLDGKGNVAEPDGAFEVKDGLLVVSGRTRGTLATVREFENYDLSLEYRWGKATHPPRQDKARSGGLLFHASGLDKIWPTAFEFQIMEGATGDLVLSEGTSILFDRAYKSRLSAGRETPLSADGSRIIGGTVHWPLRSQDWKDITGFRGASDAEKPLGEWNTLALQCEDGWFAFWVNDKIVCTGRGAEPRKGRILLQSDGAEMFFRKVELKTIGK
jgi:hypothetical protein